MKIWPLSLIVCFALLPVPPPVVVKFTMIFRRINGEAMVSAVPNQYLNVDQFGANYFAPQLLKKKSKGWPKTCRGVNLIARITVDTQGIASNPRFYAGEEGAMRCFELLKTSIHKRRFIPGMVDGVPTTMDHLNLVTWRSGSLLRAR